MSWQLQNPIDQEGTYPLPEAQLDRFLLKIDIAYPASDAEIKIMRQVRKEALKEAEVLDFPDDLPISQGIIFEARQQAMSVYMSEAVEQYIAELVQASRSPAVYSDDLVRWIRFGASPRASLAFDRCSRVLAWLDGRDYVSPEDVQQLAHEILRHRVLLNYQPKPKESVLITLLMNFWRKYPLPDETSRY